MEAHFSSKIQIACVGLITIDFNVSLLKAWRSFSLLWLKCVKYSLCKCIVLLHWKYICRLNILRLLTKGVFKSDTPSIYWNQAFAKGWRPTRFAVKLRSFKICTGANLSRSNEWTDLCQSKCSFARSERSILLYRTDDCTKKTGRHYFFWSKYDASEEISMEHSIQWITI